MLQKIKDILAGVLAAAVAVIGILFAIERSKRKNSEAENLLNALKSADDRLKVKVEELDKNIAAAKKALSEQIPPKAEDMTPAEVEKYWKNKP